MEPTSKTLAKMDDKEKAAYKKGRRDAVLVMLILQFFCILAYLTPKILDKLFNGWLN